MIVTAGHAYWMLAHQGGWDELVMFGIPIVIAIVGVRWAERRAKAQRAAAARDGDRAADERNAR